jgi:hypothetical protein
LGRCGLPGEGPRLVLSHHVVGLPVTHALEEPDVARIADVAEHHGRIAPKPAQRRASSAAGGRRR